MVNILAGIRPNTCLSDWAWAPTICWCFDDSLFQALMIWAASLSPASRSFAREVVHEMTFGALRMLPRTSILFLWKICVRKFCQTTSHV